MTTDSDPEKQLATYVRRLTNPSMDGGTRPDLSTGGDYSRRPLSGMLHGEIPRRRSGIKLDRWHVEVGLRDEPSTGRQPPLDLDLAAGAIWLTGEPKSGKAHALRCVLDDWTRRYKDTLVVHLNGGGSESKDSADRSPVYFGSGNLNAQALVIRQVWARHFQRRNSLPLLLAIERVDLLLRALVRDERTLENLIDLLRDGVSQDIFCCVTAVQSREALLTGGAREIALSRRADSPLPYAQLRRGSWGMFFTEPAQPLACGPSGACDSFGIPSPYTLQDLAARLEEGPEGHVPVGLDWLTHDVVWIGGTSLAIGGDSPGQQRLQHLAWMFRSLGRMVVQLRSPRDPDYVADSAASSSLSPAEWTKERIIEMARTSFGGVLVAPNIEMKGDLLSVFSGSVAGVLSEYNWIVLASAANAGTALFENSASRTRYLATYSQCLWLQTSNREVNTHGGTDRFPVWPSMVNEELGDAFLLRTDGLAQTLRMPFAR